MKKERENGYYWVRFNGEWEISLYYREFEDWLLIACETTKKDEDFEEIDERRIERPS